MSQELPVDRAKYREYAAARQWPGNPYTDLGRMSDIEKPRPLVGLLHSLCSRRLSQFFKALGDHLAVTA